MSKALEDRLHSLETRLQQIENVEAVRRILGQYCKTLDARDERGLGVLLSRNVKFVVVPWNIDVSGHDAAMTFFREYFRSGWKQPRHNCANELIASTESGFHTFCYFHETLSIGDQSVIGWGTWEDDFVFEDGSWKIAYRLVTVLALTPITQGWAMDDKIMSL